MTTKTEPRTSPPTTRRGRMKADRRRQLLDAAARLIAERGFHGVRLEDLGAAVGISGPAVYRHFPNKDAVLVELLVGISTRLFDGGTEVTESGSDAAATLEELVDFHVDFATSEPELIRIQDRDLDNLPDDARREVRRTQRRYVELWVAALCAHDPALAEADARVVAHGLFGLLNSTPYSARRGSLADSKPVLRAAALRLIGIAA